MKYWLEYRYYNGDGYCETETDEFDTIEEARARMAEMIFDLKEWQRIVALKGKDRRDYYSLEYIPIRIIHVADVDDYMDEEELSGRAVYEDDKKKLFAIAETPEFAEHMKQCEFQLRLREAEYEDEKRLAKKREKREREKRKKQKAAEELALYEKLKKKYEGETQ